MTEQLTKENCFNQLKADYPKAYKYFIDWIYHFEEINSRDFNRSDDFEFFTLPGAMQFGIFIDFANDLVQAKLIPAFIVRIHLEREPNLIWLKGVVNTLHALENAL